MRVLHSGKWLVKKICLKTKFDYEEVCGVSELCAGTGSELVLKELHVHDLNEVFKEN